MRHSILRSALLAAAATLVLASAVAGGGKPSRVLIDQNGVVIGLPAGDFCAFTAQIEVIVNREYLTIFPVAPDGTQKVLTTGSLFVRFSNLDTTTSKVVNISGPAYFLFYPDGSAMLRTEGLSLVWVVGAGVQLYKGQFDILSLTQLHGNAIDMCAALASR